MYPLVEKLTRAQSNIPPLPFVIFRCSNLISFRRLLQTGPENDSDRSKDVVFMHTTQVVQSVIDLNSGLPFARSDDFPEFVKVRSCASLPSMRINEHALNSRPSSWIGEPRKPGIPSVRTNQNGG